MKTFLYILEWAKYASVFIVIAAVIWRVSLWARGISPALISLGNGLANRKIAVFARNENLASMKDLLLGSKLFKESNIFDIQKVEDIGKTESASVFVVYFPDWIKHIDKILAEKPDRAPLIIYNPRTANPIEPADMIKIDGHRNTAVSNFRGRLLNDIVTSMITTSYEK